jgi:hypothetical protein
MSSLENIETAFEGLLETVTEAPAAPAALSIFAKRAQKSAEKLAKANAKERERLEAAFWRRIETLNKREQERLDHLRQKWTETSEAFAKARLEAEEELAAALHGFLEPAPAAGTLNGAAH